MSNLEWKCEYTRTISGKCEQQREKGQDTCYYHTRVREGLVDADEVQSLKDSSTIRSK